MTTFNIADTKTVAVNSSLTLAGVDATTITFQGTDTYVGRATTDTLTNKTLTSPTLSGTVTTPDGGAWGSGGLVLGGNNGFGGFLKGVTNSNVAPAGTLDLDTESNGSSWAGILTVSSALADDAEVRTSTQYAISARGTTIDAITTLNSGSKTGGMSFSLSYPSIGVIRVTNNDANNAFMTMAWFGLIGG